MQQHHLTSTLSITVPSLDRPVSHGRGILDSSHVAPQHRFDRKRRRRLKRIDLNCGNVGVRVSFKAVAVIEATPKVHKISQISRYISSRTGMRMMFSHRDRPYCRNRHPTRTGGGTSEHKESFLSMRLITPNEDTMPGSSPPMP